MMNALPLMRISEKFELLLVECDSKSASAAALAWADSGLTVRVVRGRKMHTCERLFDEFAAALQFPWYFGENPDAFDECITDLCWLPPQSGYVIVVTDPNEVLADADADALAWLVGSLSRARDEWARPVALGEWWDRPAVPFNVVLQSLPGDAASAKVRWATAGASVRSFTDGAPPHRG